MGVEYYGMELSGFAEFSRAIRSVPIRLRERILPPILEPSINRVHARVLLNMSGAVVQERTGVTVGAFESTKPKVRVENNGDVTASFKLPTRGKLGITPDDPYYYPFATEYGFSVGRTHVAAKMPIRKAANDMAEGELRIISRQIADALGRI